MEMDYTLAFESHLMYLLEPVNVLQSVLLLPAPPRNTAFFINPSTFPVDTTNSSATLAILLGTFLGNS